MNECTQIRERDIESVLVAPTVGQLLESWQDDDSVLRFDFVSTSSLLSSSFFFFFFLLLLLSSSLFSSLQSAIFDRSEKKKSIKRRRQERTKKRTEKKEQKKRKMANLAIILAGTVVFGVGWVIYKVFFCIAQQG